MSRVHCSCALGDGHSAQGDGDGAAIETSMDVEFSVDVIKGKKIGWPRLENDQYIMSAAPDRWSMLCGLACSDLINWLVADYGFDKIEAKQLLGSNRATGSRQRRRSAVLGGLPIAEEISTEVRLRALTSYSLSPRGSKILISCLNCC
ncbi:MAG: hypothetical protein U1F68_07260 [Gammaproteobacteria bacterium]